MKKGIRICCVCHDKYSFCLCNAEDRKLDPWHFVYCSENCKNIYEAASDYENGRSSANEAREKLDKLDLSKIENFGESYQTTIAKINENIIKVNNIKSDVQVVDKATESLDESTNDEFSNKFFVPRNKKVKRNGNIE